MKRFSTLLTAAAVFVAVQANAQYTENFDTNPTTGSTCVATTEFKYVTTDDKPIKDYVITGFGSGYAEPPVGNSVRVFTTPYLSIPLQLNVAFDYKLSSKLANGAGRYIVVGLIDANGNFSKHDSIVLADHTNPVHYDKVFNLPSATTARVSIKVGGWGGDGNTRVIYDNININASLINDGKCNLAPTAYDNTYNFLISSDLASGNLILEGTQLDTDADGSVSNLTPKIVTGLPAAYGDLQIFPDGTFSFTPSATFPGGPVSFTYSITDNGYPRLSDTATVYLNYPDAIFSTLPVKLTNFAGSINNNKAQLRWSVTDNETGSEFVVLRSVDGKSFTEAGTVFISNRIGAESYNFTDLKDLDATTYYKLKITNKDGSTSYSNVIALKSAAPKSGTAITILKNPVESNLSFTYNATTATQGQVSIYNAVGVKVYSSRIASQKGTNAVSLNLDSHMAAGTYILEVVSGTERAVTRMIKQ